MFLVGNVSVHKDVCVMPGIISCHCARPMDVNYIGNRRLTFTI